MEKLKIEWRVASGKWRVLFCSPFATRHLPLLPLPFLILFFSVGVKAQNRPDIGASVDSIHVTAQYMDSLLKVDSISRALRLEDERRFEKTHELATQRSIDLTGDGTPDVLRLEGTVLKHIDDTRLTFTIKSGKKLLFKDSWLAKGYFDTIDHLTDPIKLVRLRRIITIFFANENFEVADSNDFNDMMKRVDVAEIEPGSAYARELFQEPRVMYSVYHSRDYWYGLIWDPKKNRFVKAWRN